MRVIGTLLNEPLARRFGDFLYPQGIDNQVDAEADGTFAVWVAAEEDMARASEMLSQFRQQPDDPKYASAGAAAAARRASVRADADAARARIVGRRQLFARQDAFGVGPLTFMLIGACIAVAALSGLGSDREALQSLFITWEGRADRGFHWATSLPEFRRGEVWRLVSPAIIHFGLAHIIGNMMWLFDLGSLIEARCGRWRFARLVLVLAAVSNFAQFYMDGPRFGGMSGVVYGLFGYAWTRGKFEPSSGLAQSSQAVMIMVAWFFICFTGAVGPIANTAHTVGLVLGAAWGWLGSKRLVRRP